MSPYIEIERPPVLRGTEEERWQQLRRYLERMADTLEQAVNELNEKEVSDHGGNVHTAG